MQPRNSEPRRGSQPYLVARANPVSAARAASSNRPYAHSARLRSTSATIDSSRSSIGPPRMHRRGRRRRPPRTIQPRSASVCAADAVAAAQPESVAERLAGRRRSPPAARRDSRRRPVHQRWMPSVKQREGPRPAGAGMLDQRVRLLDRGRAGVEVLRFPRDLVQGREQLDPALRVRVGRGPRAAPPGAGPSRARAGSCAEAIAAPRGRASSTCVMPVPSRWRRRRAARARWRAPRDPAPRDRPSPPTSASTALTEPTRARAWSCAW